MPKTKFVKNQIDTINGSQVELKSLEGEHFKDYPNIPIDGFIQPENTDTSVFVMFDHILGTVRWSTAMYSPHAETLQGIYPEEFVLLNTVSEDPLPNKIPRLNDDGKFIGTSFTSDRLSSHRLISLSGKISGSVSFDGTQNVDIATTIQARSITADLMPSVPENKILGRKSVGSGDYEYLDCTPFARLLLSDSDETYARLRLGLGNVSTLDVDTPLGVPVLDSNGLLKTNQIPPLAITNTNVVNSESEMLLLTAQTGDICIRTDIFKTFILKVNDPSILSNWQVLPTPTDVVTTFNGRLGTVIPETGDYSYSMITGLGNSATRNIGSITGTVCAGDDPRLSDARVPLTHYHDRISVKSGTEALIADGYNDSTGNLYLNYVGANTTNWIKNLIFWDGRGSSGAQIEKITAQRFVGNADTSSKLLTARTINGTSFNGSANITTTNWGAARTITIGNTGKSVDGSANTSWSLSEIGAAATSHSHTLLSALPYNTWDISNAPQSYHMGIETSCVSLTKGFPNAGSVMTMKTDTEGAGTLQLYTPFGPNDGGTALKYRTAEFLTTTTAWSSWKTIIDSDNIGNQTVSNSDKVDGYHASTTANAANTIPVRDASGYLYLGWINTTSGSAGTTAPDRIYASYDSFLRYYTPDNFKTVMGIYNSSTSATANTNALRDSSGDITARLFRSTFAEQTSAAATTADIAFRNSTTDSYIRFMSNSAFSTWCQNANIWAAGALKIRTSAPASPVDGDIWIA